MKRTPLPLILRCRSCGYTLGLLGREVEREIDAHMRRTGHLRYDLALDMQVVALRSPSHYEGAEQ